MNSALSSVGNANARVFQMPAGERDECARGDHGVRHLLVTGTEVVGSGRGGRGIRASKTIFHGTPRGKSCVLAGGVGSTVSGDETRQARYRLIPTQTGSGTVDPTSQGWPTASASLPEGPGFDVGKN
jgi:hypothetical protein